MLVELCLQLKHAVRRLEHIEFITVRVTLAVMLALRGAFFSYWLVS